MNYREQFLMAYNRWVYALDRTIRPQSEVYQKEVYWWIYCDVRDKNRVGTNEAMQRFCYSLEEVLENKLHLYSRESKFCDFLEAA